MLLRKINYIVLLSFLCACSVSPDLHVPQHVKKSNKLIEKFSDAIENAQTDGAALYTAINSSDAILPYTPREADLVRMASRELLCQGEYTAVQIVNERDDFENIYLILIAEQDSGIQIGRHIKFNFILNTNDLHSIVKSGEECLFIPVEEQHGSSIFISYPSDETPNDFHVFLSLYYPKIIFVDTPVGLWKVYQGKITFEE